MLAGGRHDLNFARRAATHLCARSIQTLSKQELLSNLNPCQVSHSLRRRQKPLYNFEYVATTMEVAIPKHKLWDFDAHLSNFGVRSCE